jgi:hypothetical protein
MILLILLMKASLCVSYTQAQIDLWKSDAESNGDQDVDIFFYEDEDDD